MTQHIFESCVDNKLVTVRCGWDRCMNGFYLDITDTNDEEDVVYSSEYDEAFRKSMGFTESFVQLENVMAGLGLAYPPTLAQALEEDKRNNTGNAITRYGKYLPDPKANTITHARITKMPRPMPEGMLDPMPQVFVRLNGGPEIDLFPFYPDEIIFQAHEFIGLTIEQALNLRTAKDKSYLDTSVPCASGWIVNVNPVESSSWPLSAPPGTPVRPAPTPPGTSNLQAAAPPGTPSLAPARPPGRPMRP